MGARDTRKTVALAVLPTALGLGRWVGKAADGHFVGENLGAAIGRSSAVASKRPKSRHPSGSIKRGGAK